MVTVFFNASNFTLFHIPINSNLTRVVSLAKRPDPKTLNLLLNFFRTDNPRQQTNLSISSTDVSTQTTSTMIYMFLIIGLMTFLCILFLSFIYLKQRRYRFLNNYHSDSSEQKQCFVHQQQQQQHQQYETKFDDQEKDHEMIYHFNHGQTIYSSPDCSTPYWKSSMPYISEHY